MVLLTMGGGIEKSEGIKLFYRNNIKCLDIGNHYIYLVVLQANIKHTEVRKVRSEDLMKVKKILKFTLTEGNNIKAKNI